MCCPAENGTVRTPWFTVLEAAQQSMEWLFGWLPCWKGRHRIHPTLAADPESSFIVLDTKKRIRVLHLYPHLSDAVLFSEIKVNTSEHPDHFDVVDQGGSEGSGEDYWFMRWNRPLRSNFQRNSCNCSFRKSNTTFATEPKEESNNSCLKSITENIAPVISRKTDNSPIHNSESNVNSTGENSPQKTVEDEQHSSEAAKFENHSPPVISTSLRSLGTDSAYDCDIDVRGIKFSFKESNKNGGGYVNPVFLASNDSLHCIESKESESSNCDNSPAVDCVDGKSSISKEEKSIKETVQDHNANDHRLQTLEDMNTRNKVTSSVEEKREKLENVDVGRKKHRKHCNAGPKAYLKKPVLFMIHGAGSSCEVWRGLIYQLVHAGYECVAPDILGHGLSSAPDSACLYTFHSLLQDFLGVFDRFVTEGRHAVMIGHGYGCSIAAAMTRYRAEQVIQLVLISGGGPTPLAPRTPPSVSPCMRCCLEPLLMCGFKRDVLYSVCGKQIEPCAPLDCAVPRHILEHIAQGHVWPEGDAAFHRRIVSPTLLVHGMRDQHVTLVQQCEMERTIPRSFLEIIPEAGHWAMLETPEHLSHMILCFINWWAPSSQVH